MPIVGNESDKVLERRRDTVVGMDGRDNLAGRGKIEGNK